MINCETFYQALREQGIGLFAGVPDSLLKHICACITDCSAAGEHVIAANEGAAVALAAGNHLATGKTGLVYMQNSGLGNTVNPLLSLADEKVYSIPMLLMIGWRGEPGVKDEPQHVKQGEVTLEMLDVMGIPHMVLPDEDDGAVRTLKEMTAMAQRHSKPVALVVRKNTFAPYNATALEEPAPGLTLRRERALEILLEEIPADDVVVSTTGMISREIYEYREKAGEGHARDFLTVGSMGHCSQIALGVALSRKDRGVYCIDGDGAVIMHMGSLAINGQYRGGNLVHVVINNGRHDSVGGQPTVGFDVALTDVALACGYSHAVSVHDEEGIRDAMGCLAKRDRVDQAPMLLEVQVLPGARSDLGRPTTSPIENKEAFMSNLDD